jgi:hypothetical protein
MTKRHPAAVCSGCGEYSNNILLVASTHRVRVDGKMKSCGVWGSALGEKDWEVCHTCKGEGVSGDPCQRTGCIYVRKGR